MKLEHYELTFLVLALEHYRESSEKYDCRFLVKQSNELIKKIKEQIE